MENRHERHSCLCREYRARILRSAARLETRSHDGAARSERHARVPRAPSRNGGRARDHQDPRPLEWRLMITAGQAQDPTADATLPWPPDRAQIDAGTVTLDTVSSEDGGPCTNINFDPLVLPPG